MKIVYEPFATWEEVLTHVKKHGQVGYQAACENKPLEYRARLAGINLVRIIPNEVDGDPFVAGRKTLDRFYRKVDVKP